MEAAHGIACLVLLAGLQELRGGGLDVAPVGHQRFDDGCDHQALDVSARRVVGAQLGAVPGIEGALQERAEDRRLHVLPVALGGDGQQHEIVLVDLKRRRVLEQAAVEFENVGMQFR